MIYCDIKMQDITQQIMDKEDFETAGIFSEVGISKNASIVTVAMLQTKNPITQTDISRITGMPQGVISITLKELITLGWVTGVAITRPESKGRPLNVYEIAGVDVITKNLSEKVTAYSKTVRDNIAKIKELYK